jgi:hypothetical protein
MNSELPELSPARPIRTESDWREALEAANGLHDAMVKEIVLVSDGFVTTEGEMTFGLDLGARVRALIQTQNVREPAAELFFTGVSQLSYAPSQDREMGGAIRLKRTTDKDVPLRRFTFLQCLIEAQSCSIALLGAHFLGAGPFYWPVGLGTTDDLEAYSDFGERIGRRGGHQPID